MQGWNKQFDEPEIFFGRMLIVHVQVRKLLETSEIFWREGGLCGGFCLFWTLLQKNAVLVYVF